MMFKAYRIPVHQGSQIFLLLHPYNFCFDLALPLSYNQKQFVYLYKSIKKFDMWRKSNICTRKDTTDSHLNILFKKNKHLKICTK